VVICLERGADFYYLPQHARAARMHFALSHCRSSDEVLILDDDDDDNPSGQYAITCKIVASGIATDINVNTSKQSQLQWDKGDIGLYLRDLSQYLSTARLPTEALHCQGHCSLNHREELEYYHQDLIHCTNEAASHCIPVYKPGVLKHWWTPKLDVLKQQCIDATDIWKQFGRPRSGDINAN